MSNARDRLARYRDDPSVERCEIARDELAELLADEFPIGRAVRVEVLHPTPGGPLVTRELSRRADGRLVLMVDVYARERYWGEEVPLRVYFRRLFEAIRRRERDALLLASRSERTRGKAHLAYLIPSPGTGSVAEQYDAMARIDEALRSRTGRAEGSGGLTGSG